MKTYLAEVLGTFLLVFIGTASVATGGFLADLPLGQEAIGLAFGIGLIAAAYAVGPISGAHLNPASRSASSLPAGCRPRMSSLTDRAGHRRHPGLAGAVDHRLRPGRRTHNRLRRQWLGRGKWGMSSAFLWELIGTFTFVTVIPRRHRGKALDGVRRAGHRPDPGGACTSP